MKLTTGRPLRSAAVIAGLTAALMLLGGCSGGTSAGEAPRTTQDQTLQAEPSLSPDAVDDSPPPASSTAEPTRTGPTRTGPTTTGPTSAEPRQPESPSPSAVESSSTAGNAAAAEDLPADSAVRLSTGERPSGFFASAPGHFGTAEDPEALRAGSTLEEPILRQRPGGYEPSLSGFPEDAELVLQLTAPDGDRITRRGTSSSDLAVVFTNEMPVGEWQVEVAAAGFDDATAEGSIIVSKVSSPDYYQTADQAPSGKAGATIELAGFPAHTTVNFFLYGPSDDNDEFPRPLPIAVTDRNGEATYSVEARDLDPPGTYTVWFNPGCPTHPGPTPDQFYGAVCTTFAK